MQMYVWKLKKTCSKEERVQQQGYTQFRCSSVSHPARVSARLKCDELNGTIMWHAHLNPRIRSGAVRAPPILLLFALRGDAAGDDEWLFILRQQSGTGTHHHSGTLGDIVVVIQQIVRATTTHQHDATNEHQQQGSTS